jgi:hypothetical protein
MAPHPQGDALAYPGLNYLALSGINTLIQKTLYKIENITRQVSYLSAYGVHPP